MSVERNRKHWATTPDLPVRARQNALLRERALRREATALQLRTKGKNYDEIAAACGYRSESGARAAIARALARQPVEDLDEVRRFELHRLEAMIDVLWPRFEFGLDDKAGDQLIKVVERKHRLLGLDAPERKEVKATGDAELRVRVVEDVERFVSLVDKVMPELAELPVNAIAAKSQVLEEHEDRITDDRISRDNGHR